MKPLLLIGTGRLAEMMVSYLERDGYKIAGLLVDEKYKKSDEYKQYPIYTYERRSEFNPSEYDFLVAIAFAFMNDIRRGKCKELLSEGYNLINYISPYAQVYDAEIRGINNIVMDQVVLEPLCSIGSGNVFWPQSCISHHTIVENFCMFTSGVKVAGGVGIQNCAFFGLNSTVNENVKIAEKTLVGAGVHIKHDTEAHSVYVPPYSVKLQNKSSEFFNGE